MPAIMRGLGIVAGAAAGGALAFQAWKNTSKLTDQPLPTYAAGIEDGMVWVDPDKAAA